MTLAELRARLLHEPAGFVAGATVWGEARGEPQPAQLGVLWVIRHRAERRHQTVPQVCLAPWQFSCWWEAAATNTQVLVARTELALTGLPVRHPSWSRCQVLAQAVLSGDPADDVTKGADHYLTTTLYRSPACPSWAKAMRVTATIGAHTFLVTP